MDQVIDKFVAFPDGPAKMPAVIHTVEADRFNDEGYDDISFLNLKYKGLPPKGLKPWGGKEDEAGDAAPEGFYNVNSTDHNKYYSSSFVDWVEIANSELTIDEEFCNDKKDTDYFVAIIIWEVTFYGWIEEDMAEKRKELLENLDEVKESDGEGETEFETPEQFSAWLDDLSKNKKEEK